LSPDEIWWVEQLSAFAGPFTEAAVEAIVDRPAEVGALDVLEALADHHLVRVEARRCSLYHEVRVHAARSLGARSAAEIDGVRARHAAYFATIGSRYHLTTEAADAVDDLRLASQWPGVHGVEAGLRAAVVVAELSSLAEGLALLDALGPRAEGEHGRHVLALR